MLAKSFLEMSEDRKRAAFTQVALSTGREEAIVEKDFWVCWILGRRRKSEISFRHGGIRRPGPEPIPAVRISRADYPDPGAG